MDDLDNVAAMRRLDPEGMVDRIAELPSQLRDSWQTVASLALPRSYSEVDNVVVLGMGGSAIGGDLIKSLVTYEMKVPVIVHRDYGLPAFVDNKTLLIASSYSGNTEETLSGFEPALATGAKILAMTTGGKLREIAGNHNIPVFKIEYKSQPRAALGFSFISVLGVLQKLGFINDKSADIQETVQVLEKLSSKLDEKSPAAKNPAKQIARRLHGNLSVIYGAGIASEAAHRWKTQINENGKAWAFYEIFPELNHNATVGFPLPADVSNKVRVILLRSPLFHERVKLRYEVTCELLKQAGVAYEFVEGEGQSALAQMISLVSIGDYVSYYLAILNQVDPTPVKVINYLKDRLAKA
jgi:glucose/mannose-6-phosphate isomerase